MRVEHIQTPALVVDLDVLEQNQEKMMACVAKTGGKLRPHYKSNKCIQIAQMQLAAGAKGITCAKLGEARDLVEAGVEDVLIANQISDKAKIAQVASLSKCCHLAVAVDSKENVLDLEAAAAVQDATIYCLIEYEIGMGRCGVSTREDLYELAETIDACPHLVFEGIQAYAGHLSHEVSKQIRAEKGQEVERRLKEAKAYLEEHGLVVHQISGCSTASVSDHAFPDTVYTEFQAGSYIFMDAAYGLLTDLGFQNSLFVLSTVMSTSGGKIILDAGRKSISMDQHDPIVCGYEDCAVKFSEEHSTIVKPDEAKKVGDKVKIIPGHCCTCINLHDDIYFIRDGKVVNKAPITSRGKSV